MHFSFFIHVGSETIDPEYKPPANITDLYDIENEATLEITEDDLYKEWNENEEGPIQRIINTISKFRLFMLILGVGCVVLGILALFSVICAICSCAYYSQYHNKPKLIYCGHHWDSLNCPDFRLRCLYFRGTLHIVLYTIVAFETMKSVLILRGALISECPDLRVSLYMFYLDISQNDQRHASL